MSGHRTEADYVAQVADLANTNSVLRNALKRIAALDDGDSPYWWQGEPMEAIKHVRNILARV